MLTRDSIPNLVAAAAAKLIEWPAEHFKHLLIREACVVCGAPADGARAADGTAWCAACAADEYVRTVAPHRTRSGHGS